MKTKAILLTTALMLSTGAWAQSSPSSSTPSTQDSGPAVVEVDKEALLEVVLGRIHRVYGGVQALKDTMNENGATTFRDIYMIEGSVVNENDYLDQGQYLQDSNGRNRQLSHGTGFQILPYELTLTRDGHFSGKIAGIGGKNLNSSENAGPTQKVINGFRLFEFEWDTDTDKINTTRLTIGSMDMRLGLFKRNGSWVSLNLGGAVDYTRRTLPDGLGRATTDEGNPYIGSTQGINLTGRAGFEFHIALGEAYSLHGLTMYQVAYLVGNSRTKSGNESVKTTGLRSSLTNQLEFNYHFDSGHRGYKSSAGIYLQSQHLQRDIMHRGPEVIDVGRRDRDFSGNTYTGGFQIKW